MRHKLFSLNFKIITNCYNTVVEQCKTLNDGLQTANVLFYNKICLNVTRTKFCLIKEVG